MRLKNSFGNCSKCGKQIMWIKTKAGKSMPWEKKFKEDTGIEEPRDDPSVTWKIYNSYYEAYRKGEIA